MNAVVNRIETGHLDLIHDAKGDFLGKMLATCSGDRSVKIYELRPNGQHVPIAKLNEHQGPVWKVSWAHPIYGELLASCSYDRKVIVWKGVQSQWSKALDLAYHEASVNAVAWAPKEYGLRLAFGSSDGSISVVTFELNLEIRSHNKIADAHPNGCNAVSWAPPPGVGSASDPHSQPDLKEAWLTSGGCDGTVKIWREDADGKWSQQLSLQGHRDWVRDVEWDLSSTPTNHRIASCSQDRTVIIWRCSDLNANSWTKHVLSKFSDVVWGVSWSSCGMFLAVSYGDNQVSIWKETFEKDWINVSNEKRKQKPASGGRRR